MSKLRLLGASILLILLSGCATIDTLKDNNSIGNYRDVKDQVKLGDTKESVLAVLMPAQKGLPKSRSKDPEMYLKNGVLVEIYYFRSRRQADGLTTDDEFTPYVFNDGKLMGIGWAVLGGPPTQGQAVDEVHQTVIVH